MRYEFDGMHSIHLQSGPSIQHHCTHHHLFSLTLIRHPLVIPCCVMSCLFFFAFSPEQTCSVSFIPSEALLKRHISYDITTCDFPPLWYHCQPYDSLYLDSFPYFLHLISESDSVIYNPLAQDLKIGKMVVEIISGLAMVYREWSGVHVYGFICRTSSAVSAERALTSSWKWVEGARFNAWDNTVGLEKKLMNWEDGKKRKTENDPLWW